MQNLSNSNFSELSEKECLETNGGLLPVILGIGGLFAFGYAVGYTSHFVYDKVIKPMGGDAQSLPTLNQSVGGSFI